MVVLVNKEFDMEIQVVYILRKYAITGTKDD